MDDVGLFVKYLLIAIDSNNHDTLWQFSVSTILVLVDAISAATADRNKYNETYIYPATGVLPQQLVRTLPHDFSVYL